jgi:hypothetical protein
MTCLHFSDQSRQLVSQDVGVNRLSDIGADVGAALGRSAVTGDLGDELAAAAQGVTSREISDLSCVMRFLHRLEAMNQINKKKWLPRQQRKVTLLKQKI